MTFFFYDLETSGLDPRQDRVMQFAGQRTDESLQPIGDPYNILLKLDRDTVPDRGALQITGLDPKQDGLSEAAFATLLYRDIFTPDTVTVGFNNIGFDDEFLRFSFWRSFADPYAWAYGDGKSRWDILNLVRMTRALRPEGINWPTPAGRPSNRLEHLTRANQLDHFHAHDALSDVEATIAVARLIRERQPKLFHYLLEARHKMTLENVATSGEALVLTSKYVSHPSKTTVIVPYRLENGRLDAIDVRTGRSTWLKVNQCPTIAPISVLSDENWQLLELDPEAVYRTAAELESTGLGEKEFTGDTANHATDQSTPPTYTLDNVDAALYDGFLNDADKRLAAEVRRRSQPAGDQLTTGDQLADFHPNFADERLGPLLLLYKARNFPAALAAEEAENYKKFCADKKAKIFASRVTRS